MKNTIDFWNSKIGILFRWFIYIPFGMIALILVQSINYVFLAWLFRDARGFIIIGLLLGGIVFIWFSIFSYYLTVIGISKICPSSKNGMKIFAGIYYLHSLIEFIYGVFYAHDPLSQKIKLSIMTVATLIIATAAFIKIFEGEKNEQFERIHQ